MNKVTRDCSLCGVPEGMGNVKLKQRIGCEDFVCEDRAVCAKRRETAFANSIRHRGKPSRFLKRLPVGRITIESITVSGKWADIKFRQCDYRVPCTLSLTVQISIEDADRWIKLLKEERQLEVQLVRTNEFNFDVEE